MTYLSGRQKYNRPQAMLWSNNVIDANSDGFYEPVGKEVGQDGAKDFLILSDHNRSEIGFTIDRLEKRERMVNGRMRSWHIGDKRKISVSWSMLPSRSFSDYPSFDTDGVSSLPDDAMYTVDGGAGGMELFDWYQEHTYPFYVFLSYDKFDSTSTNTEDRNNTGKYTEVIEMYITDFKYDVIKRSGLEYDFWNVSVTLEEV